MSITPTIEYREAQPYIGIVAEVTIQEIGTVLPPLHDELAAWLADQGVSPAGPPFFRYLRIDMEGTLDIDVGIPVEGSLPVEGKIHNRVLPAGDYGTLVYTGHYEGIQDVTRALLAWAEENGIVWASTASERGKLWESRLEIYLNDPADVPPDQWQTQLAFMIAPK